MDTNILEFKPRKGSDDITDPVYECNGCGSQDFTLRPPALIECSECQAPHVQLMWSQLFISKTYSGESND